MMIMDHYLIITAVLLCFALTNGQQCGLNNTPVFGEPGNMRIAVDYRQQVIVPGYQFTCSGLVSRWRMYVQPGGRNHRMVYMPIFQAWRPIGSNRYELIGEHVYNESQPVVNGGDLSVNAHSSQPIYVQPGDVIGFYLDSDPSSDPGGTQAIEDNVFVLAYYYEGQRGSDTVFDLNENRVRMTTEHRLMLAVEIDETSIPTTDPTALSSPTTDPTSLSSPTTNPTSTTMNGPTTGNGLTMTEDPPTTSGINNNSNNTVTTPDNPAGALKPKILVPSILLGVVLIINLVFLVVFLIYRAKHKRTSREDPNVLLLKLNEMSTNSSIVESSKAHEKKSVVTANNKLVSNTEEQDANPVGSRATIPTRINTAYCGTPANKISNSQEYDYIDDTQLNTDIL